MSRARLGLARLVRGVLTLAAAVLAVAALLVAVRHDVDGGDAVVRAVVDVADAVAGPLGRHHGVFTFTGADAATRDALVNWCIAAVVYLVVGRLLARLLRPRVRERGL